MLVFNQKIVNEINTKTSKGEPVVVKVKTEPTEINASKKNRKKVDSVTTGTMETKIHFAQSHIAAQNTNVKKIKK